MLTFQFRKNHILFWNKLPFNILILEQNFMLLMVMPVGKKLVEKELELFVQEYIMPCL